MPQAVIDFAARLLPHVAPDLTPPESVRDDPGHLDLVRVEPPTCGTPSARSRPRRSPTRGRSG
nr:hypothetical protein [Angustibacter aerolatus]